MNLFVFYIFMLQFIGDFDDSSNKKRVSDSFSTVCR